jgi:hypothetical protein
MGERLQLLSAPHPRGPERGEAPHTIVSTGIEPVLVLLDVIPVPDKEVALIHFSSVHRPR